MAHRQDNVTHSVLTSGKGDETRRKHGLRSKREVTCPTTQRITQYVYLMYLTKAQFHLTRKCVIVCIHMQLGPVEDDSRHGFRGLDPSSANVSTKLSLYICIPTYLGMYVDGMWDGVRTFGSSTSIARLCD